MEDVELEKLALAELLQEAKRGEERYKELGASGWLPPVVPPTNKRFLANTLKSTLASTRRRSPRRDSYNLHRSRKPDHGISPSRKDSHRSDDSRHHRHKSNSSHTRNKSDKNGLSKDSRRSPKDKNRYDKIKEEEKEYQVHELNLSESNQNESICGKPQEQVYDSKSNGENTNLACEISKCGSGETDTKDCIDLRKSPIDGCEKSLEGCHSEKPQNVKTSPSSTKRRNSESNKKEDLVPQKKPKKHKSSKKKKKEKKTKKHKREKSKHESSH